MRVVILGGGVVGVTTAYQLQKDGHEVVVLERNALTAAGTSWGNAGMIAPGHSFVWSSPKAPINVSAPEPPLRTLAPEFPSNVSLLAEPIRFSIALSVSPSASPPWPAPVTRLTVTAAEDAA